MDANRTATTVNELIVFRFLVDQVRAEYFSKISELDMLTYSSPKDLWLQDLDALEVRLKVSFLFLGKDFFISFFLGFFKS